MSAAEGSAARDSDALGAFDFSSIDEMDPSLSGGHRLLYEREVPFELRVQQAAEAAQEVGTLEAVKVKLLVLGDEGAPSAVRVELTSENDLFFNYTHTLDQAGFRQVQEAQKLMVEFSEYSTILIRMLGGAAAAPRRSIHPPARPVPATTRRRVRNGHVRGGRITYSPRPPHGAGRWRARARTRSSA